MDSHPKNILAEIFALLSEHDTVGLKMSLATMPSRDKGSQFELVLAELYRGNGWLIKRQGGRGDAGADLLLYHPKTPSNVSLIIQAKNHSLPLTFDQVRIELIKFEEQSAPLHKCQNFRLVAVNGYVHEAGKLGDFNLLLDGWEHIEKLVSSYNPETTAEPTIELFAHNLNTYQRINEMWEDYRHVGVVQATGTGKSYLIAKVLADFMDKRKVVLAPSTYILEQQKNKLPWLSGNTDYLTYAKLARMTSKEISALKCSLIVLDEFHRCGADVWGAGVQKLLDSHSDAKIIGTTATPIRYLDDSRDMAEELFDGIVAEDLSLAEAIVRRILPPPTYISALYTLNEECSLLIEEVESSKRTDAEKTEFKREINSIRLDWEKSSGVSEILKKHLPPNINKLIVFCKDQKHLDEMEIEVQRWFLKAGSHKRRKTYRILSADPESNLNLEEFKKASGKDTVHLLFTIDMLNEGLHIPEVGAVILLRPTESPIIFYQQIGRCIQVGKDHTPIIFDLVNNFQNVRAKDLLIDLEEAKEAEARHRSELGLSEYSPSIRVEDFSKPIEEVFSAICERLVTWEVMFDELTKYAQREGHCRVKRILTTSESYNLGSWIVNQRSNKTRLSQERRDRLESLPGWSWDPFTDRWEEGFRHLQTFIKSESHARVPDSHVTSDGFKLGVWVGTQRIKKNKMSQERRNCLESLLGWSWDPIVDQWEEGFKHLEDFIQKKCHAKVSRSHTTSDGYNLGAWVSKQRTKKDKMSQESRDRLESLPGWSWDPFTDQWEEGYRHLQTFVQSESHMMVPDFYVTSDGFKLGVWVGTQRIKKNKMSQERRNCLESLPGWSWDPFTDQWEEGYKQLEDFIQKKCHAWVPISHVTSEGYKLGSWVGRQRTYKSRMSQERRDRLESLPGWSWDTITERWEEGFQHLEDFIRNEGHARPLANYTDSNGYKLGGWVKRQRIAKDKMPQDRRDRLESLPRWSWDTLIDGWEEGLQHLEDFVRNEGHASVPSSFITSCGYRLGRWVGFKRKIKDKMSQERRDRLDKVTGWSWIVRASRTDSLE